MMITLATYARDGEVLSFWGLQARWQKAANEALAIYFG